MFYVSKSRLKLSFLSFLLGLSLIACTSRSRNNAPRVDSDLKPESDLIIRSESPIDRPETPSNFVSHPKDVVGVSEEYLPEFPAESATPLLEASTEDPMAIEVQQVRNSYLKAKKIQDRRAIMPPPLSKDEEAEVKKELPGIAEKLRDADRKILDTQLSRDWSLPSEFSDSDKESLEVLRQRIIESLEPVEFKFPEDVLTELKLRRAQSHNLNDGYIPTPEELRSMEEAEEKSLADDTSLRLRIHNLFRSTHGRVIVQILTTGDNISPGAWVVKPGDPMVAEPMALEKLRGFAEFKDVSKELKDIYVDKHGRHWAINGHYGLFIAQTPHKYDFEFVYPELTGWKIIEGPHANYVYILREGRTVSDKSAYVAKLRVPGEDEKLPGSLESIQRMLELVERQYRSAKINHPAYESLVDEISMALAAGEKNVSNAAPFETIGLIGSADKGLFLNGSNRLVTVSKDKLSVLQAYESDRNYSRWKTITFLGGGMMGLTGAFAKVRHQGQNSLFVSNDSGTYVISEPHYLAPGKSYEAQDFKISALYSQSQLGMGQEIVEFDNDYVVVSPDWFIIYRDKDFNRVPLYAHYSWFFKEIPSSGAQFSDLLALTEKLMVSTWNGLYVVNINNYRNLKRIMAEERAKVE